MKYCQKCGKQLVDEAVVCTGCGCSVASFWKRGFSLPKRSPEIDSSKTKLVRKLLYTIEALILIFAFMMLFIKGFWIENRELEWNCGNSREYCFACEKIREHYLSTFYYEEGLFEGAFFGDLFDDIEVACVFGIIFIVFWGIELIVCLLQIFIPKDYNIFGTSIFGIGSFISFVISYCNYMGTIDVNYGSSVNKYRDDLPTCEGCLYTTLEPTIWCYVVIFIFLLAVALDISAKILYWKAKRQTRDAEENKAV